MKIRYKYIIIGLLLVAFMATSANAQNKKLAQTSFQFLSVVSDARAAAMADAMTAMQVGSSALFFNPAGMADMHNFVDLTASNNKWIADIQHNTFSMAVSPKHGSYGVIGFSLQSVDYGDFYGTVVDKSTDAGYRDTGTFKLNALALGVGYAKQLTDRFSVGGQVRWVRQDLGNSTIPVVSPQLDTVATVVGNELTPLAFDFGTQFRTDFKSLVFGMSVRNFSKEIKYVEEGFQLPLVFNLGISMNLMDFMEGAPLEQALIMSVEASHYRSHPEQIRVGLDYRLMNALSLRGGYVSNNDESGFSFGFGVGLFGLAFDYAYTPFGVFDNVQRMTARFSL
jgi:hypothetical protein